MSVSLRRRGFLKAAGMGTVTAVGAAPCLRALAAAAARPQKRPNLLLLLSDDQRADAMGCAPNAAIKTPALDRLASQGVRFRNAFVTTSICCVSRASVLAGQYARRHGIHDFARPFWPEAMSQTYPMLLKKAGYYTGFIGKWGIAANNVKLVNRAGATFDYWAGASHQSNFWHEADCPFVTHPGVGEEKLENLCTCPPDARGRRGIGVRIGRKNIKNPVHLSTQIIPAKVDQFLRARDKARPFCLSISFKAPHGPWSDWDPSVRDLYVDAKLPVPKTATPAAIAAKPAFLRRSLASAAGERLARDHARLRRQIGHYYRLISTLDISVGKVRKLLADHGLADNTVILFSSDNGHFLGEHGLMGKWLMYEESIRVPLIVSGPGLTGEVNDELVLNADIAPTLLDLAGLPTPANMHGSSLVPFLRGDSAQWRASFLYEAPIPALGSWPLVAVRSREWKYIRTFGPEDPSKLVFEELYDLRDDPHEMMNLAGLDEHRDTRERLAAELAELRQRVEAR